MNTSSSLFLLAALGLLSTLNTAAYAADPSEWTCESCPFPKGMKGSVEVGVGGVSDASAKFGDFKGLQAKEAHLVLGGTVSYRGEGGYFASARASDLGLDSRTLSGEAGREGLYALRVGYSEIPRYFGDGALTPFRGNGSSVLTLPAGFAAGTTTAMPLATTLQPVELGYQWSRLDIGAAIPAGERLSFNVSVRRDVRDGTKALAASFFSTAAQMASPVDQVTDQLEVSAAYHRGRLQASLGYQFSQFTNNASSLTWDNPFLPVVAGSTTGRLALAPDNQFHQIYGSAGYTISPTMRASADFAVGRMTQNEPYLASTLTPGVAAGVPPLPAAALDGKVDTFSGSLRLTATPMPKLRLNASYTRDVRNNDTTIRSYPQVATDMFLSATPRSNTPFDLTRDRVKLSADWRGPGTLRLSGGADHDLRSRNYTEVVETRETTVWARATAQPTEAVALGLKLSHAERSHPVYGIATWFGAPENPLLRKFNLAERRRNSAGLRADFTLSDRLSLGLGVDLSDDDYHRSLVGLTSARSANLSADLAFALNDRTRLTAFAQGERIRSRQTGSQLALLPDWTGRQDDRFEVLGLGIRHAAIVDKLDVGADITFSRSRSEISVTTAGGEPPFPTDKTALDSVRLFATYKLSDKVSLNGGLWYETYEAQDWRLAGVNPSTIANLLTFGLQPPSYSLTVVRASVRYRF